MTKFKIALYCTALMECGALAQSIRASTEQILVQDSGEWTQIGQVDVSSASSAQAVYSNPAGQAWAEAGWGVGKAYTLWRPGLHQGLPAIYNGASAWTSDTLTFLSTDEFVTVNFRLIADANIISAERIGSSNIGSSRIRLYLNLESPVEFSEGVVALNRRYVDGVQATDFDYSCAGYFLCQSTEQFMYTFETFASIDRIWSYTLPSNVAIAVSSGFGISVNVEGEIDASGTFVQAGMNGTQLSGVYSERFGVLRKEGQSFGYEAAFDEIYGTSAVPEPRSWAMLIVGFAMTGLLLRRNYNSFGSPEKPSSQL